MKIGLYGGSFDPIHYGHIRPVREARKALALDRVIYLPTANPPHKSLGSRRANGSRRAPALARYAMVEMALLNEQGCFASTYELGDDVSYTVNSLEHFQRRWPEARLFLILGSDSLRQLDTWRDWRRILELAELAVLERPEATPRGGAVEPLPRQLDEALDRSRVHRIANVPLPVSSTEIRRRLATHPSAATLPDDLYQCTPPLVLDYIAKYDLYR